MKGRVGLPVVVLQHDMISQLAGHRCLLSVLVGLPGIAVEDNSEIRGIVTLF